MIFIYKKIEILTLYWFYKNSVMLMLATSPSTVHNLSLSPIASSPEAASNSDSVFRPLQVHYKEHNPWSVHFVPYSTSESLYFPPIATLTQPSEATLAPVRAVSFVIGEVRPVDECEPMASFHAMSSSIMIPAPIAGYVTPLGAQTPRAAQCQLCDNKVHHTRDLELCGPCDEYLESMAGGIITPVQGLVPPPIQVPIGMVSIVPTGACAPRVQFPCALCQAPEVCASEGDYCASCMSDPTVFLCWCGIPEIMCDKCEQCPRAAPADYVPASPADPWAFAAAENALASTGFRHIPEEVLLEAYRTFDTAPLLAPVSAVPFDPNRVRLPGTITPNASLLEPVSAVVPLANMPISPYARPALTQTAQEARHQPFTRRVPFLNVPGWSVDGTPLAAPEKDDA